MIPETLKIWLIIFVLIYFILILLFLKNKALELRYTLLWLFAGVIMGILVIFPQLMTSITRVVGIQDNMNGLYIFAMGFMLAILMALTSIVSRQSNKICNLIQTIAILEKRIRELEKKNDARDTDIDNV